MYENKSVQGNESKEDVGDHVGVQREITVYLTPETPTNPVAPKRTEMLCSSTSEIS